jgi:hypothetical protein
VLVGRPYDETTANIIAEFEADRVPLGIGLGHSGSNTAKACRCSRRGRETLAICRSLVFARAVFAVAVADKPAGRFMIRSRTRVVIRHPQGDW